LTLRHFVAYKNLKAHPGGMEILKSPPGWDGAREPRAHPRQNFFKEPASLRPMDATPTPHFKLKNFRKKKSPLR